MRPDPVADLEADPVDVGSAEARERSCSSRRFAPGARLSVLDVVVLIATGVGALSLGSTSPLLAKGLVFVVGHFFLFCNIFRIRRAPELVWAFVFTALAAATILSGQPGWPLTFVLSGLLTIGLLGVEMRHPSYHGLLWQWVNPNLPLYWQELHQSFALNPGGRRSDGLR